MPDYTPRDQRTPRVYPTRLYTPEEEEELIAGILASILSDMPAFITGWNTDELA